MVVDEKILELFKEVPGQIFKALDVGMHVIGLGDGYEAVVANPLLALKLFTFDDANKPGKQETAREGWLVHQDEHVDGIAVVGDGAGQEAEVVGKGHSSGENFLQEKISWSGSKAYLFRLLLGVSMMT